jgi:hypothetical protein
MTVTGARPARDPLVNGHHHFARNRGGSASRAYDAMKRLTTRRGFQSSDRAGDRPPHPGARLPLEQVGERSASDRIGASELLIS